VGLLASVGVIGGFVALEGGSSLILLADTLLRNPTPTFHERLHTRYDPELGWVGRSNVFAPDLYGPGVYLRTNAQGFRNNRDIPREAPPDRLRAICSGDSFTLGYGVDNDHAWCRLLEAMDPRLETVNMGQGGYGVGQSYLWYARDGAPLEHAVHVFALITGDFYRMRSAVFVGHGKPVLAIEEGTLVAHNVPVPRRTARFPFLIRRLRIATSELRASQLLKRVREKLGPNSPPDGGVRFDEPTWQVASKVFASLAEMSRERGAALVVVHLPTGDDYTGDESDPWRERLRDEAEHEGFTYVDLIPEFRDLSLRRVSSLLIPKGSPGTGHYNEEGHRWVADHLRQRLSEVPFVRERLRRLERAAP
jgi:hypothetical protein